MTTCYDWNADTLAIEKLSNVWSQCPSGDTCCIGIDTCLDYNLCQAYQSNSTSKRDTANDEASMSGYYVARCSDPTFTGIGCQKICNAPGPPDAVYNATTQQWRCCGTNAAGNVSCDDPIGVSFSAPAPADLHAIATGMTIVSTQTLALASQTASTSASSPTSSSTTADPSTTAVTQHRNTLSGGAIAGIAVGAVVGTLIIFAVAAFLYRRRHQGLRETKANVYYSELPPGKQNVAVQEKSTDPDHQRSEMASANDLRQELSSDGHVHELGSSRS